MARKSVYVGPVAPENVPAVRVVETSVPGEVTVSWDAPAADIDGRPLKDENLTYMVYVADGDNVAQELLEEPIASREAKFTVCATDEQAFALFYVKVFNLGLESLGFTRSDMVPVGKPAEIPYSHRRGAQFLHEPRQHLLLPGDTAGLSLSPDFCRQILFLLPVV